MFILPSVLFSGLAIQFLSVTSFEFVVTSDPDSFSRCFVDNFTAGEDPYILPSMLFIRCYIHYSGKAMLDVVPRNRTHCAAIEGSIAAFCRMILSTDYHCSPTVWYGMRLHPDHTTSPALWSFSSDQRYLHTELACGSYTSYARLSVAAVRAFCPDAFHGPPNQQSCE